MKTSSLLLIALVIVFAACRRDRTCACTVTEEGTVTTHNQTPGSFVAIDPLPPIPLVAPIDTTMVSSMDTTYVKRRLYKKVKLRTARYNCISFEEDVADSSRQIIPGTATITTIESGKKYYSCVIE